MIRVLFLASFLAWFFGCATGTSVPEPATGYAEAKSRYVSALERDVRAGGLSTARLVPIPPTSEPFKPGAAFKKGATKPASQACIVPEHQSPEAKKVRELWASGLQPRFVLDGELPEMVNVAAQQISVVGRAATLKQSAMVSLADTTQISMTMQELLPIVRNETCLNALVGSDVVMVMGIIYGAEAVSNSRYLEVGAHQDTLKNRRYRVMYDSAGGFYLQEAEAKPKYWIMSAWRVDVKVEREATTPEERTRALKALVKSNQGELAVKESVLSDQDVQAFLDNLRAVGEKKIVR